MCLTFYPLYVLVLIYSFVLLFFLNFGTVLGPAVMQCSRNKVKVHDEKKYFELWVRLLSPSLPDAGQFLGTWRPVLGFCHRAISPSGHGLHRPIHKNTRILAQNTRLLIGVVCVFIIFLCSRCCMVMGFFSYKCSCLWSIVSFYLVLFVFLVFFFFYLSCSAVVVSRIMVWMLRCAKHIWFPRGSPYTLWLSC